MSKRLMQELSQRLESVRDEFKLRLYHWSLDIIEGQTSADDSLFWKVPSRVIRNLHRFLSDEQDPLRFFLLCHGYRHRSVLSRLGQAVPSDEGLSSILRRCIDPSGTDVTQRGLLPLSTPVPRLNRRKLHSAIRLRLAPAFLETTDPSDHREWSFERRIRSWRLVARATSSSDSQLDLEFDVILGMGDLSLARQLSLHRLLGIGPSAWDLVVPGEEEKAADLVGEYSEFLASAFSGLLADLVPGVTEEDVRQAESEWKAWVQEMRAKKAPGSRRLH